MGVRNRDRADTAQRRDQRFGCRVEVREAIPQNIALRRSEQKRALVDSEPGNGFKAKQGVVMLLPGVGWDVVPTDALSVQVQGVGALSQPVLPE